MGTSVCCGCSTYKIIWQDDSDMRVEERCSLCNRITIPLKIKTTLGSEERMANMEERMANMEERMANMEERIKSIEDHLFRTKLDI